MTDCLFWPSLQIFAEYDCLKTYCVLSIVICLKILNIFLPQLIYEFSSGDTHFYASFISSLFKKT
jgi:hypothetical protein